MSDKRDTATIRDVEWPMWYRLNGPQIAAFWHAIIDKFYEWFETERTVIDIPERAIFVPYMSPNVGIYDFEMDRYTDGPPHNRGTYAFLDCVPLPDGREVFVPANSTNVGIYDPATNTYTDGPAHGLGISDAFYSGALAPNGKVIFVPCNSPYVGIYDPVEDTYTNGPAHGRGSGAFVGGVLAPNGKIIFIPTGSTNIGIYDPVANTYTNGPAHGRGGNAFIDGVLAPNGKVIFVPFNSSNIGIYDPVTNTYANGPAHNHGLRVFIGAVLDLNGKVIIVPYNSSNIGIYDPVANTYTDGPSHGHGATAFYGGVLNPNTGKIILVPYTSTVAGIYDPVANTYTDGPTHGHGSEAFGGGAFAPEVTHKVGHPFVYWRNYNINKVTEGQIATILMMMHLPHVALGATEILTNVYGQLWGGGTEQQVAVDDQNRGYGFINSDARMFADDQTGGYWAASDKSVVSAPFWIVQALMDIAKDFLTHDNLIFLDRLLTKLFDTNIVSWTFDWNSMGDLEIVWKDGMEPKATDGNTLQILNSLLQTIWWSNPQARIRST